MYIIVRRVGPNAYCISLAQHGIFSIRMDKDLGSQLLAGSASNASDKQLGTVLYLWSSIIFVFKSIREEIVPEADVFILRMVLHRYHIADKPLSSLD